MKRIIPFATLGLVLLLTGLGLSNCGDKQIPTTAPAAGGGNNPTPEPTCTWKWRFERREDFDQKSFDLDPGESQTMYTNLTVSCDSTVRRVWVRRYLVKEDGQRLKVRLINNATGQEISQTLQDITDYEGWDEKTLVFLGLPHGSYKLVLHFIISGTSAESSNGGNRVEWDQSGQVRPFDDCFTRFCEPDPR